MMFGNPLIRRYCYSLLRPRQLWIYLTVYTGIILLLLFLNYTVYKFETSPDLAALSRSIYFQFLTFQVIILLIWGTYNSGSAIQNEISEKTYDFFRMLPLPARQKTVGILIGKNLVVLLLAAVNCPFLLFSGWFGKVNSVLQMQILLTLACLTVLSNSTALLSSINTPRKTRIPKIAIVVGLLFFIGPVFHSLFALSRFKQLEKFCVRFFLIEIPILLLISFIALYFSAWVIKGIIRRFNQEKECLFTRNGALLFMLGYEIIALGLFIPHLSRQPKLTYIFWLISFVPAVLVVLGSLRNLDKYIEYSRFIQTASNAGKSAIAGIFMYSNLCVGFGLFAVWAAFSIGGVLLSRSPVPHNLYTVLVLLSFYLFGLLLLELYCLYSSAYNRIGLLLGFIFAVQAFLPLILSSIMSNPTIFLHSPLGYFSTIAIAEPVADLAVNTRIALLNLCLCFIPAVLIYKQYSHILLARQKM